MKERFCIDSSTVSASLNRWFKNNPVPPTVREGVASSVRAMAIALHNCAPPHCAPPHLASPQPPKKRERQKLAFCPNCAHTLCSHLCCWCLSTHFECHSGGQKKMLVNIRGGFPSRPVCRCRGWLGRKTVCSFVLRSAAVCVPASTAIHLSMSGRVDGDLCLFWKKPSNPAKAILTCFPDRVLLGQRRMTENSDLQIIF